MSIYFLVQVIVACHCGPTQISHETLTSAVTTASQPGLISTRWVLLHNHKTAILPSFWITYYIFICGQLLMKFGLSRIDVLESTEHIPRAINTFSRRLPTYVTIKDVKKRWGRGQVSPPLHVRIAIVSLILSFSSISLLSGGRLSYCSVREALGRYDCGRRHRMLLLCGDKRAWTAA